MWVLALITCGELLQPHSFTHISGVGSGFHSLRCRCVLTTRQKLLISGRLLHFLLRPAVSAISPLISRFYEQLATLDKKTPLQVKPVMVPTVCVVSRLPKIVTIVQLYISKG